MTMRMDGAAMVGAMDAYDLAEKVALENQLLWGEIQRIRDNLEYEKSTQRFQDWIEEFIFQFDKTLRFVTTETIASSVKCHELLYPFMAALAELRLDTSCIRGIENKKAFERVVQDAQQVLSELKKLPEVQKFIRERDAQYRRALEMEANKVRVSIKNMQNRLHKLYAVQVVGIFGPFLGGFYALEIGSWWVLTLSILGASMCFADWGAKSLKSSKSFKRRIEEVKSSIIREQVALNELEKGLRSEQVVEPIEMPSSEKVQEEGGLPSKPVVEPPEMPKSEMVQEEGGPPSEPVVEPPEMPKSEMVQEIEKMIHEGWRRKAIISKLNIKEEEFKNTCESLFMNGRISEAEYKNIAGIV
jgi:hypothetical protein